ncbi:MAG: recombinase family protein [Lachnospiraceae bacterium]|nr:recombinase family protein [Lachnospiraceae bacterium]
MYSETLSGKGSDAIAAELIELGAPTKKGGKWTSTSVRGILSNEKYTGDCIFQKTYTDERFNRHTNYGEMDQFYMEGHHDAIVSHEDFEAVAALVEQRAKEKGITRGDAKYQARYPMSGKVFCGECGSPHKRRMNYSTHIQYPALTCSGHLKDKNSCSQKFIREDALQMAFVTMMNKLIFAHKEVLQPLLTSLRSISQKDAISRLSELDERLEKNAERQNTLTTLMTRGYIDPALFTQESNDLLTEAQALTEEKEHLVFSVNGEMKKTEKLADLIRFCSRGEMLTEFEGDCFSQYVERVVIHERTTAAFELKCGLTLKERIR